tara:strand:+ start:94 stop:237 length:144 start_codon:yes stop_codon:yes gene_type:complete
MSPPSFPSFPQKRKKVTNKLLCAFRTRCTTQDEEEEEEEEEWEEVTT